MPRVSDALLARVAEHWSDVGDAPAEAFVRAMARELMAARRVVEAARLAFQDLDWGNESTMRLDQMVRAYDAATGGAGGGK